MEIVLYRADLAEDVTAAYNRHIAGMPHCYPATVKRVAAALAPTSRTSDADADEGDGLQQEVAWVALDAGCVVGWGHAGVGQLHRSRDMVGVIRFLWYERGRRAVGQALLERLERHLGTTGVGRLVAFHQDFRYPFYHWESAYLSDRLGHVHALMGWNSYERSAGEVYLDWPEVEPPEVIRARVAAEVTVEERQTGDWRPDVIVRALVDGRRVGTCHCVSGATYAPDDDEADAWSFCHWLGVDEPFQGRGLGRQLLQQAIRASVEAGYRHAAISTALHNYRAALLYTNVGYRVADWTYGLSKGQEE